MSRPDFISWAESPAGMYLHDKKKPTLATWQPYQRDILSFVFPAGDGLLPYNRIIWSDVKKSGKTELAAAVHEYFAFFVGDPGEHYVLANDFEGAKSRVFKSITGSLAKNPHIKAADWKVVGNQIELSNGTTIKAIASDYRGEAGSNHKLASVDEPWGIVHESSKRLMTEFSPVPTLDYSTIFYTGYQGFEGESEFWHNLIDVGMDGEPVPELMHIDDGTGKPACWHNGRTFVFWNHEARMPWHTPEYMADQERAHAGRLTEFRRVWQNTREKNADAFLTDEQWDKLYDPKQHGLAPGDKRLVVLGADAATESDCCALEGTTWNPETHKVEHVFSEIWYPEKGTSIKLTRTIGPKIVELHQKYNVVGVYFDTFQMKAIAEMCQAVGVNMIEFPQTARRIESDTHLHRLLWDGNFAHYDDRDLKEHLTNALSKKSERGRRIVKELTKKKIDGAVALAMSALGAVELLASPESSEMESTPNPFFPEA